MELLGMSMMLIALFVGFGLLVGILFGFFGMGGSFLVTPALLVMGYEPKVAVGSGLAFVFGTSVIATLKHRDLGQVDYKLGVSMIIGTTLGIEVGKEMVLALQELGLAGSIISVTYVVLLGGIGAFVTYESLKGGGSGSGDGGSGGIDHDAVDAEVAADDIDGHGPSSHQILSDEIPDIAKKIQSYRVPPMLTLRGGIEVSLWMVLAVAFATGLLSGLLGVGGGFIRMPALFYLIGVPVPIAVGTDLFEIVFSGGIGSFLYAQSGGVDLGIVAPLLAGSALGARLGSAATAIVAEDEIKVYFGAMLLGGALAVAIRQIGIIYEIPVFDTVSLVLILGSALLVASAVVYSAVSNLRSEVEAGASSTD